MIAVSGADGSGHAALCRQIATELGQSRLVLFVNVVHGEGRSLLPRLCTAAGAENSPEALETLVARLGEERHRQGSPPVVVLEGVTVPHPSTAELASLVGAALWTRSFKVLLGGGPGLVEELARAGIDFRGERVPELPSRRSSAGRSRGTCRELARGDARLPRASRPRHARRPAPARAPLGRRARARQLHRREHAAARRRRAAPHRLLVARVDGVGPGALVGARALALPRRPAELASARGRGRDGCCRRAAGMPPWPARGRLQRE